ncbi:MAG TPA: hypothetical protein VNF45_04205 [Candidatus Binataceae bacterium]|nr:hypothetical protein [Candidatus Binataceae bacterium]
MAAASKVAQADRAMPGLPACMGTHDYASHGTSLPFEPGGLMDLGAAV